MLDIDEFKPDFILALWRGGASVGVYIHEYLMRKNVIADHMCIRTSIYTAPNEQESTIDVHTLKHIVKKAKPTDNLLIVDDIFDSGRSLKAVIDKMTLKMGAENMPKIRIATMFWKTEKNKTNLEPHYYLEHEGISKAWVVLPHEISAFKDDVKFKAIFGTDLFDTLKNVSHSSSTT